MKDYEKVPLKDGGGWIHKRTKRYSPTLGEAIADGLKGADLSVGCTVVPTVETLRTFGGGCWERARVKKIDPDSDILTLKPLSKDFFYSGTTSLHWEGELWNPDGPEFRTASRNVVALENLAKYSQARA